MAPCQHPYASAHEGPCPHVPSGAAEVCLWHNPAVRKGDAYVAAVLTQADRLAHGDFAEAHLSGLVAPRAQLAGRILRAADLRDARLDHADLRGADLRDANLRRASLQRAQLDGATLRGADLTATVFTGASLRGADLTGARLDGTIFKEADLSDADLTDAVITGFAWNRLTKLAGCRGLDPAAFDLSAPDSSFAFNPDDLRTRIFFVPKPALAAGPRRPSSLMLLSAGAAALIAALAAGGGGWLFSHHRAAVINPGQVSAALAALTAENHALTQTLAQTREAARMSTAQAERQRERYLAAATEASRLNDADDRAASLSARLDEATDTSRELALASSRQEHLSHILASGVARLDQENRALQQDRAALTAAQARVSDLDRDANGLRRELADASAERDRLRLDLASSQNELTAAHTVMERYLARVQATRLDEWLLDDGQQKTLLAVQPGVPIALSGDWLVTLRVDPSFSKNVDKTAEKSAAIAADSINVEVVVQRPGHGALPDVTVALYDEQRQPLRRVAYSFAAGGDSSAPFLAAGSRLSCARFPAFARVVLTPPPDTTVSSR